MALNNLITALVRDFGLMYGVDIAAQLSELESTGFDLVNAEIISDDRQEGVKVNFKMMESSISTKLECCMVKFTLEAFRAKHERANFRILGIIYVGISSDGYDFDEPPVCETFGVLDDFLNKDAYLKLISKLYGRYKVKVAR